MFAEPGEENFAPHIDRTSRQLAASLDPIHQRQGNEQRKREDRLFQLAAAIEDERRREETFAPRINKPPPGVSLDERVPLAERTNRGRALACDGAGEEVRPPVINTRSEQLVTSGVRANIDEGARIKKRVQQLWASHAESSQGMSKPSAVACLRDIGVNHASTEAKFLMALGFVDDASVPKSEHVLTVSYDHFCKVLLAVLKAAVGKRDSGSGQQQPAPSVAPRTASAAPTSENPEARQTVPTSRHQTVEYFVSRTQPRRSTSQHADPTNNGGDLVAVDRNNVATLRSHPQQPQNVTSTKQMTRSRSTTPVANAAPPAPQKQKAPAPHVLAPPTPTSTVNVTNSRGLLTRGPAAPTRSSSARAAAIRTSMVSPAESFAFKPRINETSAALASSKPRGPVTRPAVSGETLERIAALRAAQAEHELSNCTFAPRVSSRTKWTKRGSDVLNTEASDAALVSHTHNGDSPSPSPQRRSLPQPEEVSRQRNVSRSISLGASPDVDRFQDKSADMDESGTHYTVGGHTIQHAATSRSSRSTSANRNWAGVPSRRSSSSVSSTPSKPIVTAMLGVTPGFEKAVQRMAAGRSMSRSKFEESLRGGAAAYNPHVFPPPPLPADEVSPLPPTEAVPFQLRTEARPQQREQTKPILYVDVDLPHNRVGRIGVHRGVHAMTLARNFCTSYGLDHATEVRLEAVLQQKIDAVMSEHTRTLWV